MSDDQNQKLKKKTTTFFILLVVIMLALIALLIFLVVNVLFSAVGVMLWVYAAGAFAVAALIFTATYWLIPLLNKILGIDMGTVE